MHLEFRAEEGIFSVVLQCIALLYWLDLFPLLHKYLYEDSIHRVIYNYVVSHYMDEVLNLHRILHIEFFSDVHKL